MTSIVSDTPDIKKKFNTFKANWFRTIDSGICDKNFDNKEIIEFIQNWKDKECIKDWLIEQLNELSDWVKIKDDIIDSQDLKEDFEQFRKKNYDLILNHLKIMKTDEYKAVKKGIAPDKKCFLTLEKIGDPYLKQVKRKEERDKVIARQRYQKLPRLDSHLIHNPYLTGGKRKKKTRKKTRRKPIRINPNMHGVFTKKAKRKRMSVQKYANYIVKKYKGKKKTKKQLKLFRQALFAKTAKKWKKKRKLKKRKTRKRNKKTRKKRGGNPPGDACRKYDYNICSFYSGPCEWKFYDAKIKQNNINDYIQNKIINEHGQCIDTRFNTNPSTEKNDGVNDYVNGINDYLDFQEKQKKFLLNKKEIETKKRSVIRAISPLFNEISELKKKLLLFDVTKDAAKIKSTEKEIEELEYNISEIKKTHNLTKFLTFPQLEGNAYKPTATKKKDNE